MSNQPHIRADQTESNRLAPFCTPFEKVLGGAKPPRPSSATVEDRRGDRKSYAATGEGLARRVIYRYPPRGPYAWVDL